MTLQVPADVAEQVRRQVATGSYSNESEVLREAMNALVSRDGEMTAINDALDDLENGDRGRQLADVFADLRLRHGLPTDG